MIARKDFKAVIFSPTAQMDPPDRQKALLHQTGCSAYKTGTPGLD
jgi:hypothetical protein